MADLDEAIKRNDSDVFAWLCRSQCRRETGDLEGSLRTPMLPSATRRTGTCRISNVRASSESWATPRARSRI